MKVYVFIVASVLSDSYGYSNYFVNFPNNIVSKYSVTNILGTLKFTIKKDYR